MRNLNRKHYCSGELLVHWLHYEPRIGGIIPARALWRCMACLCFLMVLFFAIEGRQPDKGTLRRSFIDKFCPGHINPHKGDPKLAGGKRKWDSRRRMRRRGNESRTWKQNWICPARHCHIVHPSVCRCCSCLLAWPGACWTRLMRFSWPLIKRWNILRIRHAGQSRTFNWAQWHDEIADVSKGVWGCLRVLAGLVVRLKLRQWGASLNYFAVPSNSCLNQFADKFNLL